MTSSIRSILLSSIFFLEFFSSITIFCSFDQIWKERARRRQQETLEEKNAENSLKAQESDLNFARLALPGYGLEVIVDREPVYHLQFLQGNDGTEEIRGTTQSGTIMAQWSRWEGVTSCVKLNHRSGPSTLPDSIFFLLRAAYKQKEERDRTH